MPSPIHKRHLSFALSAGTWRHVGRRARWLLDPARSSSVPLSWPLTDEVTQAMRIRWPRRYGQRNTAQWLEPIRRGIAAHVALEPADIVQPAGNIVLLEVVREGQVRRVAIDYEDRLDLHVHAPRADLYFKLQYNRDGYDIPAVRPGGYVSHHLSLYRHASDWRALRRRAAPSTDVLGRFGLKWAQEIRTQAIAMLREQDRFEFRGGASPVWWGAYMDEVSTARVCLDLPGRGEFCFRLVECLAVGACLIGPELGAEMPVPLQSGVHLQRVPRSLEGLVEWCERLVADDALRARIEAAAADYFDRYLALEQLGAYYVDSMWRSFS